MRHKADAHKKLQRINMFKLNTLASAIAIALVLPNTAFAEFEVSGEAKIEYGLFSTDGTVTGGTTAHEKGDAMKSESSLKLFINSDVGEDSSFHAEVLLSNEGEAASKRLEGGEPDGQYEVLREFYFDTSAGDWFFRLGKQQVVWGTADGIKLLDMINPTDYRELNQNAGEDSRIPVWMVNAEKDLDNGGNIQIILSESKSNFISGLGEDGANDAGAPFLFKGVDTITGKTNGFLNIARDFGKTAGVFQTLLDMGGLTSLSGGPMALTTVSGFTALGTANAPFTPDDGANFNNGAHTMTFNDVVAGLQGPGGNITGGSGATAFSFTAFPGPIQTDPNKALLNVIFAPFMNQLQTGNEVLNQASNNAGGLLTNFEGYLVGLQTGAITAASIGSTNAEVGVALTALGGKIFNAVAQGMGLDPTAAGTATQIGINLSPNAPLTPGTQAFNNALQAAGIQGLGNAFFSNSTTNQFTGTLDTANPTSAFDYMGNTAFGTFDAFIGMKTDYRNVHANETNQNLGFRYKNATDGGTNYSLNFAYRYDSNPYVDMHWEDKTGNELSVNENQTSMDALGQPRQNADGTSNGNPNAEASKVTTIFLSSGGTVANGGTAFNSQSGGNPATLVFEEKLQRITTLGASFDTALETSFAPVVLRGEFTYDKNVMQPIVNLDKLSIGNLTEALTTQETDYFKYVLGVDITVMTNLLVSTQVIQFYNLDFKDGDRIFTGDPSTLSLANGLNKGDEVETFVSFFLSKPFGNDYEHRWNNIIIAENGGGYWNRFDVEYGINDELVGTFEINRYWGDKNTTFGQFETSSNVQLGLKYLF